MRVPPIKMGLIINCEPFDAIIEWISEFTVTSKSFCEDPNFMLELNSVPLLFSEVSV